MALANCSSPSSRILIGQFKTKPPENCEKDVTKLSKTSKNFVGFACNNFSGPQKFYRPIAHAFLEF